METSGFFNANKLSDGTFDRTYLADTFADYFSTFIGNGVFANNLGGLSTVLVNASQRTISVASGRAFINGYWYKNDTAMSITLPPTSGAGMARGDSIMLRFDSIARTVSVVVVSGTEGNSPVYPAPVRDGVFYDLRLAIVSVNNISIMGVSDLRASNADCGFVIGTVQSLNTTGFIDQLDGFLDSYMSNADSDYQNTFLSVLQQKTSAAQTSLDAFNSWISAKESSTTADIEAIKTQANTLVDGGETSIQQQLSDFSDWIDAQKTTATNQINALIQQIQDIIDSGDVSTILSRLTTLETGQSSLNTALAGKMNVLTGGTVGNNVVVGAGGQVADSGKVSINSGDAVGGNLTGSLPNPMIANISISQQTEEIELDWATAFTNHIIGMNAQGRITSRQTQTITIPEIPHAIATEPQAVADTTQRLMCVLE